MPPYYIKCLFSITFISVLFCHVHKLHINASFFSAISNLPVSVSFIIDRVLIDFIDLSSVPVYDVYDFLFFQFH